MRYYPGFFRPTILSLACAAASHALADHTHVEEVVVQGSVADARTINVAEAMVISPDTALLLKKAPGANV
ncbi:MAG: hypothetical protein V2J89_08605, partial [Halieaceae bacterium]|nr:hypothetical protein [Halieaceae bacterium]